MKFLYANHLIGKEEPKEAKKLAEEKTNADEEPANKKDSGVNPDSPVPALEQYDGKCKYNPNLQCKYIIQYSCPHRELSFVLLKSFKRWHVPIAICSRKR